MGTPAPIIIPGTHYGSLELTGVYIPGYKDGKKKIKGKVECKCDCGSTTYKVLADLKRGLKSCGYKCPFFGNVKHGLSKDKKWETTKRIYCLVRYELSMS